MLPLVLADVSAAANDPAWLKLFLGALPWVMTWALGHHFIKILGDRLKADGAKRGGIVGKLETAGGALFGDVDDLGNKDVKQVTDLLDPAKRPDALKQLETDAKAAAPAAVEDVAKAVTTTTPIVLAVVAAVLIGTSCKTAPEPMAITRDTIQATDKAFLATQIVMDGLKPNLTQPTWESWTLFELRFATTFHAARVLYDDAEKAMEIASAADGGTDAIAEADLKAAQQVIASFTSQLGYWQGVAAQLSHPDGGLQ